MSSTASPHVIASEDWLSTRREIWSKSSRHLAVKNAVAVLAFAAVVIIVSLRPRSAAGAFVALTVSFSMMVLVQRASLRRTTAKFAPIYVAVTEEVGGPVSVLELVELLGTSSVPIGEDVLVADVSGGAVRLSTVEPGPEHFRRTVSTPRADAVSPVGFIR